MNNVECTALTGLPCQIQSADRKEQAAEVRNGATRVDKPKNLDKLKIANYHS